MNTAGQMRLNIHIQCPSGLLIKEILFLSLIDRMILLEAKEVATIITIMVEKCCRDHYRDVMSHKGCSLPHPYAGLCATIGTHSLEVFFPYTSRGDTSSERHRDFLPLNMWCLETLGDSSKKEGRCSYRV